MTAAVEFLCCSGSTRQESFNYKVVELSHQTLLSFGKTSRLQPLRSMHLPLYDADHEAKHETPELITGWVETLRSVKALVVSSPEYNGSIGAPLKNLLDWASRSKPNPFAGKHVLLMSAAPGPVGGMRGLWHTRVPFEALGCHVFPQMLSIPKVSETLGTEEFSKKINLLLKDFSEFVGKFQ